MYGCLTRTLDRRLSNTTVNRPASFNLDLFDITRRMLAKRMPRYHIRHFHIFFIRYTRYTNLPSYISISFQAVAAATAGALFPVTKTTSTAANLHITPSVSSRHCFPTGGWVYLRRCCCKYFDPPRSRHHSETERKHAGKCYRDR
jgi:hypothetical protein